MSDNLCQRCDLLERNLARAEQERDEAQKECEALEDAVRENLPEVTADADGNLETNEVARIETVGLLYRELEKERDAALALLAEAERVLEAGSCACPLSPLMCPHAVLLAKLRAHREGVVGDAASGNRPGQSGIPETEPSRTQAAPPAINLDQIEKRARDCELIDRSARDGGPVSNPLAADVLLLVGMVRTCQEVMYEREPGNLWEQADVHLARAQALVDVMLTGNDDSRYRLLQSAKDCIISARGDLYADLK